MLGYTHHDKSPGKAFLRGQQVDLLLLLYLVRCSLLSFLHSFYLVSYLEGGVVPWLHPYRPLAEIRDRFKAKILFLEIYDFGTKNQQNPDRLKNYVFGTKSWQNWDRFKVVNFLFQMSFRSSVVLIKCHFD